MLFRSPPSFHSHGLPCLLLCYKLIPPPQNFNPQYAYGYGSTLTCVQWHNYGDHILTNRNSCTFNKKFILVALILTFVRVYDFSKLKIQKRTFSTPAKAKNFSNTSARLRHSTCNWQIITVYLQQMASGSVRSQTTDLSTKALDASYRPPIRPLRPLFASVFLVTFCSPPHSELSIGHTTSSQHCEETCTDTVTTLLLNIGAVYAPGFSPPSAILFVAR